MSERAAAKGVVFIILLLMMPAFLQMSFVGHDLFAVGCAMVTVTVAVHRAATRPGGSWALWGIAAAILATARMPLAVFPVTLAVLAHRTNPRFARRFLAVAATVLAAAHLLVFAWGQSLPGFWYQPAHVFGRGARMGAATMIGAAILLSGLAVWWWRQGTRSLSEWLLLVWITAGLPFVAVGLHELVNTIDWDWSNWEGKVYAGFALPLLIAAWLSSRAPDDL